MNQTFIFPYKISVFHDKKGMDILENEYFNEVYVRKRVGSKLELLRQNYVFCRNEEQMLLSQIEYTEENSFCKVNGSMILRFHRLYEIWPIIYGLC